MKTNLKIVLILLLELLTSYEVKGQISALSVFAKKDVVMLRDGKEIAGKIVLVNNDSTYIQIKKDETNAYPNIDVYMLKYAKRGTVFFTEKNERITGTRDGNIPSGATAIYMLGGEELIGYDVNIGEKEVSYRVKKNKNSQIESVLKGLVFLIKYPDGSKEILNDFVLIKLSKKESELREAERLRLERLKQTFPRDVTLKLKNDESCEVRLLSEDEQIITFILTKLKKGPVFRLKKKDLLEIVEKSEKE